jgi:hypothetical protein
MSRKRPRGKHVVDSAQLSSAFIELRAAAAADVQEKERSI